VQIKWALANAHAKLLSRNLVRRSKLFRDALASLYVSVGLFALGSLVGAFVDFFWPTSVWFVGGFTIAGIGFVVFAAAQLFRESLICLDVIREHSEAVTKEGGFNE
jgi:formate/nitrite transporter FocA (FNT family)